jgi:hypothetical protein
MIYACCRNYFLKSKWLVIFVRYSKIIKMKTNILLIRIGGVLNVLFLLFHLAFYWLFNWKNTLSCLDLNNWGIFHALAIIADFLFLLFVVVSFFQPEKLVTETNGRRLLFFISAFYLVRIALEFILWGNQGMGSLIIVIVCAAPAVLYGLPLLRKKD